jgi:hypothetical protein
LQQYFSYVVVVSFSNTVWFNFQMYIYIYVNITLSASIPNNFVIKIFSLIRMAVRWFPSDTQVSSTNKTDYHNIAKILLQTALKTNKHKSIVFLKKWFRCDHNRCMSIKLKIFITKLFGILADKVMFTYIYIHLKIKPNSVRIRFLSCQIFVLPSTWFELTPLIHCSTNRLALCPAL